MDLLQPIVFISEYNDIPVSTVGYYCGHVTDSGYNVPLVVIHDEKLYDIIQKDPSKFNINFIKDNHSLTLVKPWDRCIIPVTDIADRVADIDAEIECLNQKRDMYISVVASINSGSNTFNEEKIKLYT